MSATRRQGSGYDPACDMVLCVKSHSAYTPPPPSSLSCNESIKHILYIYTHITVRFDLNFYYILIYIHIKYLISFYNNKDVIPQTFKYNDQ